MFQSVEYNGFLYDCSQKIELLSASLLEKAEENGKPPFARMPYIGFFRVRLRDDLADHKQPLPCLLVSSASIMTARTEPSFVFALFLSFPVFVLVCVCV